MQQQDEYIFQACHPERSQAKSEAIGLAKSKDPYLFTYRMDNSVGPIPAVREASRLSPRNKRVSSDEVTQRMLG
jgi:hypothetical protein